MLRPHHHQPPGDPSLDFIGFLSARLELEPPAALDALGTFLVNFEPQLHSGSWGAQAEGRRSTDAAL